MSTPATVGVDDDLSAGNTGITLGATNDEETGRLEVEDGVLVNVLLGNDGVDDLRLQLLSDLLSRNLLAVLSRDNDGVDSQGNDSTAVVLVLHGDLGLGVRSEPREGSVPASLRQGLVESVGEKVREGVEFRSFVGGIAEHETLVTGTQLLQSLLVVKTLSDIGGLLLNGNHDVAGLVVEALVGGVVADLLDGASDDVLVVNGSLGGDLTEDHDHTGLGGRLASDLGEGVLSKAGIEDGIGNLITDLVGVAFTDGFRLVASLVIDSRESVC